VKAHSRLLIAGRSLACAALLLAGVACAPLPTEPLAEKVDPNTGTTLATATAPLQLISNRKRTTVLDPFSYVGPFETNKQGEKHLYLWIGAPEDKGALSEPTLYCDDKVVQLEPLQASMRDLGLSGKPYPKPAPWVKEWFYHLSEENLSCLADSKHIALVVTRTSRQKGQETFTADNEEIAPISAFAASR
jgi:hypothetical protein